MTQTGQTPTPRRASHNPSLACMAFLFLAQPRGRSKRMELARSSRSRHPQVRRTASWPRISSGSMQGAASPFPTLHRGPRTRHSRGVGSGNTLPVQPPVSGRYPLAPRTPDSVEWPPPPRRRTPVRAYPQSPQQLAAVLLLAQFLVWQRRRARTVAKDERAGEYVGFGASGARHDASDSPATYFPLDEVPANPETWRCFPRVSCPIVSPPRTCSPGLTPPPSSFTILAAPVLFSDG